MIKKAFIICIASSLMFSCANLERQFVRKPVEAAELCNKYFPTKITESSEIIEIRYDTFFKPQDSVQCPPSFEIKESTTTDGQIKYDTFYKPGEKIACPQAFNINTTKYTTRTITLKDITTETILEEVKEKNIILTDKNERKTKWIWGFAILNSLYVLYRILKSRITSKLTLW